MTKPYTDQKLTSWVEHSLATRENVLAVSNQGTILLFEEGGEKRIVKTAMGSGLVLRARQKTLRREFTAYQRMEGLTGVPRCYGMLDGLYLVVEYIDGTPYRHASWSDRDGWFERFLSVLQSIHARGVSHGDLKSKSNILVTRDEQPCVIDFGTAFLLKDGFHPVNNWFFRYGERLDINAWVKHKYHGRYVDASEQDSELLRYGRIELIARKIKRRPMDAVPGGAKSAAADEKD